VTSIAVIAAGAVSPLGVGRRAFHAGEIDEPAEVAIRLDPALAAVGLRRPFCARVDEEVLAGASEHGDRAAMLLFIAARELATELDRLLSSWRSKRVGCVIGTSGGGMPSLERLMARREAGSVIEPELARRAPYFGPLTVLERALGVVPHKLSQVLAACASSTVAIGLGCRWLELDRADLILAGGYDALSDFIASGFEALGATTAGQPQPFRRQRDGMALGEGAGLVALVRDGELGCRPLGYVRGFGAASDATHITAPHRQGAGLQRAAVAALSDAELDAASIELVSAHATATPFNDAAEGKALDALLGMQSRRVVVHPYKAQIGHTLGAAGVLEGLAALDALQRGILPAAAGAGAIDPDFHGVLLERNMAGHAASCLKLSAAFGGANAALVLARDRGRTRAHEARAVYIWACGKPVDRFDLSAVSAVARIEAAKLSRLDAFSELAVTAAANALADLPFLPERTGVVVGTAAATLEVNDLYDGRRRQGRPVEPRRFPPTSPNLAGGECSIAFSLRGPSLAVGATPAASTEALVTACDLLQAGDAEAMLVICADQVGELVRDTWSRAAWPLPKHGACAIVLAAAPLPAGAPPNEKHPTLDPSRLDAAHVDALAASGSLGGHEPGWPTFLAALDRATAPEIVRRRDSTLA
jgi:3-oxoacyl-[acyl-carrier-protein] synthase-1/3-oxoacyl-[acyl-carrier-protein] synthase II